MATWIDVGWSVGREAHTHFNRGFAVGVPSRPGEDWLAGWLVGWMGNHFIKGRLFGCANGSIINTPIYWVIISFSLSGISRGQVMDGLCRACAQNA